MGAGSEGGSGGDGGGGDGGCGEAVFQDIWVHAAALRSLAAEPAGLDQLLADFDRDQGL
jgi:hypothetical protein